MAYQLFVLPGGREEIRCTSGRNTHIVRNLDGSWSVEEDERKRIFANRGEALDCAREIAGDPDLPPPTLTITDGP